MIKCRCEERDRFSIWFYRIFFSFCKETPDIYNVIYIWIILNLKWNDSIFSYDVKNSRADVYINIIYDTVCVCSTTTYVFIMGNFYDRKRLWKFSNITYTKIYANHKVSIFSLIIIHKPSYEMSKFHCKIPFCGCLL